MIIKNKDILLRIKKLAEDLNNDYKNLSPVTIIGVMDGSLMFLAALLQEIKFSVKLNTIKSKSYIGDTRNLISTIEFSDLKDIKNHHVLLVDDICDTGETLKQIDRAILELEPLSLATVVLIHKKIPGHKIYCDYKCFEIENEFVVGFGMDYNGLFRNNPDIVSIDNVCDIDKRGN